MFKLLTVSSEPNLFDKVDKDRDFATFAKDIVEKNTADGM